MAPFTSINRRLISLSSCNSVHHYGISSRRCRSRFIFFQAIFKRIQSPNVTKPYCLVSPHERDSCRHIHIIHHGCLLPSVESGNPLLPRPTFVFFGCGLPQSILYSSLLTYVSSLGARRWRCGWQISPSTSTGWIYSRPGTSDTSTADHGQQKCRMQRLRLYST